MKLIELLSEAADLKTLNIHQLADLVTKAIEQDQKSEFKPKIDFKMKDSNFGDQDSATFTVDYVNTRQGPEEQHQNSTKKLNVIIDPLYKQFKQAGITFTQPKGVSGSISENDRYTMGKIEFTIAKGE